MAEILSFKKAKKARDQGQSPLCREGFHKWLAVKDTRFDVKQGKLLTLFRCQRCGKEKIEAK